LKQVTKLLRHAQAFVSVLVVLVLCSSCGSTAASSPPPTYEAAILEGQTAAQAAVDGGASAISIAFFDAHRILWSQTFGLANRETQQALTAGTMFGIGSVGKTVAAVAVMKLVDRGAIDLDKPLVTYLPAFRMASPGYENITPRMLLDHSSGFPGTDYRNGVARGELAPGYKAQVLETLSTARLKAPPGFMSVYCNDGYTVVEALIEATTGKSYAQFVQDEILTPLGMANTRFPIDAFPAGSYAVSYANGMPKPQERLNLLASGAIYSTPEDMARLAMMFLGGGAVDTMRILTAGAVTRMAVDATAHSFNPIHSDAWAYGLGWDTVVEPGLHAVGFDGWVKGGDTNDYGATFVVSPKAQLGVVVLAAGKGSSAVLGVAERVLLRALAERGAIASVPSALPAVASPAAPAPAGLVASIAGEYAQGALVLQLEAQPDGALQAWLLSATGRIPAGPSLTYREDGWFASDEAPLRAFKVVDADLMGQPAQYLVVRAPGAGYGHYLDSMIFAQRVQQKPADLSPAWQKRLTSTWLVVNEHPDELAWNGMDPRLRLYSEPTLKGLLAISAPVETPPAGAPDSRLRLVDPSTSDTSAASTLVVPQLNGRDLEELKIETRGGEEWARLGSYLHRPLGTVPLLTSGPTEVTIGPEGHAEWLAVSRAAPVTITLTGARAWHLYDATFTSMARGNDESAAPSLPAGSGLAYLTVFGAPGQTVKLVVQ
jgi:CubicO group peptidase (beta-lactamase class C family)